MGDDVRGGSGRDERGNPRRLGPDGRPVRKEPWSRDGADRRPGGRSDDRGGRRPPTGRSDRRPSSTRSDDRPRGNEPELSPPPPYEPEVWVREDTPAQVTSGRRREKPAPIDSDLVSKELGRLLTPAKAKRFTDRVGEAARAFGNERLDDARRILKPIAEAAPGAASVRELLGLTLYQLGRYRPAATELEAFRELTGSVDQNPVLADCYRALGRHTDAEELWEELRVASPSAGSLADRDRLADAIRLLESAPRGKKAHEHHLRTAYALADLRERAGDVSRARELFAWIAGVDADFADVRRRLSALS
jgi:hypothetical protein